MAAGTEGSTDGTGLAHATGHRTPQSAQLVLQLSGSCQDRGGVETEHGHAIVAPATIENAVDGHGRFRALAWSESLTGRRDFLLVGVDLRVDGGWRCDPLLQACRTDF